MGRADIQLHSNLGDGLNSPAEILDAAERSQMTVIALTDHDDIRGSFVMRDLAARRSSPVSVIPGIEVTTRSGHLLALFVEQEVPMFRPLAETILAIHRQGGLAIVPHPLSFLTFSIGERALRSLVERDDGESFIDGMEVVNPSYAGRVRSARAVRLNAQILRVAETGSSDAHHAELVGTAWTDFPGEGPEALAAAIRTRQTTAGGRTWTLREHLRGAAEQQYRAMVRDPAKRAWSRRPRSRAGGGGSRGGE